jgi:hypothetical protein
MLNSYSYGKSQVGHRDDSNKRIAQANEFAEAVIVPLDSSISS